MLADPLLSQLGRRLFTLDSGLGLYRLVHLHDALTNAANRGRLRSILSVGSGGGIHEAVLARLFPQVEVVGVDLREPYVDVKLDNLRFVRGDLTDASFAKQLPFADFVFSIECLEHISDDREVFSAMSRRVTPGGMLYVEVPFASDEDLRNETLIKEHMVLHEHVRPGYSAEGLRASFEWNDVSVEEIAGTFWFPMQPLVWFAMERFGEESLLEHWPEFLELATSDVRKGVQAHRGQATGIKALGVRRG